MVGINEIVETISKSPEILKEIYGDLAKPGVTQAGKALGTVIGLGNTILWPIALLNEKARITLEENFERYRRRIQNISEEDITEIPPEIGVPIVEKLTYVSNETLREMYIELLAKASSIRTHDVAHPSFVNILNNLSPDEGKLLKQLSPINQFPYLHVRLQHKGKTQFETLSEMYTLFGRSANLDFLRNVPTYVSNLKGLGLVEIRDDQFIVGENVYEPIEGECRAIHSDLVARTVDRELKLKHGLVRVTPFGRFFLRSCVDVTQ